MKKRLLSIFLALLMATAVLPGAVFAEENVSIHVRCASGQSTELTYPLSTKISQIKGQIAQEFGISFDNNEYWLYCGDAGKAKNNWDYRMETISDPALSDYFTAGQELTFWVEKSIWEATKENPVRIYGFEIYGGKGGLEPSRWLNAGATNPGWQEDADDTTLDFYWSHAYSSIHIRSSKPLTISGTAQDGADILISTRGDVEWAYITLKSLKMNNSSESCISINPYNALCLTLEGKSDLEAVGKAAGDPAPVINMSNDDAYLWIRGDGELNAISRADGQAGIGSFAPYTTGSITIEGGMVNTYGAGQGVGLRAAKITVTGGVLTATAGNAGVPGILARTEESNGSSTINGLHIGNGMKIVLPDGGVVREGEYRIDSQEAWASGDFDVVDLPGTDLSAMPYIVKIAPAPEEYSVTYHKNGGTIENESDYTKYLTETGLTLPTPKCDGYNFEGWYENENFSGEKVTEIVPGSSGNKEFYAKWTAALPPVTTYCTLYFESNGGSKINPITAPSGTRIALNQRPERHGYVFDGWYLDIGLTQKTDEVTLMRDMTVYAKWVPGQIQPGDTGVSKWLDTVNHKAFLRGYEDGTFRPERDMTRGEAAQMFYNLLLDKNVAGTVTFKDVSQDAWYAEAVRVLAALDVVRGVGDGCFAPERPITRAEFTAIAMKFASLPAGSGSTFGDVLAGDWFYAQVTGSAIYGWVTGYPDGNFRPQEHISRAEVATIVDRMLERSADQEYVDRNSGTLTQFKDISKDHWAYYAVMEAANTHGYTRSGDAERWN